MEGRPARIDPVFIWQTEPTWFRPSAQQDRMMVISSTCSPTLAYQSETHIPLCPYCFHLRREAIRVLCAVPRDVWEGLPMESGTGLPSSLVSRDLGSNRSTWLGPPSINRNMTDLARGGWCGFLGSSGSSGAPGPA